MEAPEQKTLMPLEEMRQMYATTENVARAIESGDYVLVDVKSETLQNSNCRF
jgi:hypothetical protein